LLYEQILNTETNILFIISQQYLNEIRFIGKQNKVEIYSPNDKTLDEIHGHLIRQMAFAIVERRLITPWYFD
jgi:predicted nucleic acid-binding protein